MEVMKMKQKVAVERNLTPVKDFLADKGWNVETIDFRNEYTKQMDKYDAIVVTGMNDNFLGVNDTNTRAVVIDASGLTPEQVYHELQLRFD